MGSANVAEGLATELRIAHFGDVEIPQLEHVPAILVNVSRLNVPMNDAILVQIL